MLCDLIFYNLRIIIIGDCFYYYSKNLFIYYYILLYRRIYNSLIQDII